MIRSSISRLLVALLPVRALAAIEDLLAEDLRAGRAREDALEGALEQALRDLAEARSDDALSMGLLRSAIAQEAELRVLLGEQRTRAEKAEALQADLATMTASRDAENRRAVEALEMRDTWKKRHDDALKDVGAEADAATARAEKAEAKLAARREPLSRTVRPEVELVDDAPAVTLPAASIEPWDRFELIAGECIGDVTTALERFEDLGRPAWTVTGGWVAIAETELLDRELWRRLPRESLPTVDDVALFEKRMADSTVKPVDPPVFDIDVFMDAEPLPIPVEETAPANDCDECSGSGTRPGHGDPCINCEGMGKLCGWCAEPFVEEHVCAPEEPTHERRARAARGWRPHVRI